MSPEIITLHNKKVYFASDFHLGAPTHEKSLERERKIIRWLSSIQHDAEAIFFVGDVYDFWFEYNYTIPKGFIRFQGKLAELADLGIKLYFFRGNHDMWMFGYYNDEFAESHGAHRAGGEPKPWMAEIKILGGPHLVLADAG